MSQRRLSAPLLAALQLTTSRADASSNGRRQRGGSSKGIEREFPPSVKGKNGKKTDRKTKNKRNKRQMGGPSTHATRSSEHISPTAQTHRQNRTYSKTTCQSCGSRYMLCNSRANSPLLNQRSLGQENPIQWHQKDKAYRKKW